MSIDNHYLYYLLLHPSLAVDIWSAGVILLSFLSGRYPFFKAKDDLSSLAQIITVFGTKEVVAAGNILGRRNPFHDVNSVDSVFTGCPLRLEKLEILEKLKRINEDRIFQYQMGQALFHQVDPRLEVFPMSCQGGWYILTLQGGGLLEDIEFI